MGINSEASVQDAEHNKREKSSGNGTQIVVGAFFQDGLGLSTAWVKDTKKVLCAQVWALGEDNVSTTPPAFVLESSILHALLIEEKKAEEMGGELNYIHVTAGNWRTSKMLAAWFETGELGLLSVARTEIIKVFYRLEEKLRCPLTISKIPEDFFDQCGMHSETAADAIVTAVRRFFSMAVPKARQKWAGRLARLPWTTEEFKHHLKRRYRNSEREMIGILAAQGSMSSAIFCQLRLTREVIKEAIRRLQSNRMVQTVLATILCATRFKYFNKQGRLMSVSCGNKCGQVETFEHLLKCNNLRIPRNEDNAEVWIKFLCTMARRASKGVTMIPTPMEQCTEPNEEEISLSGSEDREPPSDDTMETALSFDRVE